MSFRYVSSARAQNSDHVTATDDVATSSSVLEALARRDLEDQAAMSSSADVGPGDPIKKVSPRAFAYLGLAQDAIDHTKKVITHQGNQIDAIKSSGGNSKNRLMVMRDESYWSFTSDYARNLAYSNDEAYTAAKAAMVHGGNCGEHAAVAFNYLVSLSCGVMVQKCSYSDLDHGFVIMGDLKQPKEFPDSELVVADPWPMSPEACLWEDHFANGRDRAMINVHNEQISNATNLAIQIKAGLVLSDEGARLASQKAPLLYRLVLALGADIGGHNWDHEDAAVQEYDYKPRGP